ncbi:MAG: LON peptidase substrate-binding domain-containing protein [Ignavibacteria bacterium]
MDNKTSIHLFPLGVVLFPHSKLPLYIFEPRYKLMINECLNNETVFGINFISENKMHNIGCTASVDKVVNTSDTGEMNIITKGMRRYDLTGYEMNPNGYYQGEIKFLDDFNTDFDKLKMEKAVETYNELVETVYKGKVEKIDLTDIKWCGGKRSMCFLMAEKCGLDLNERQNLLEKDTEDKRLDIILKYFEDVVPKIMEADKITNIIKGDGYIQ